MAGLLMILFIISTFIFAVGYAIYQNSFFSTHVRISLLPRWEAIAYYLIAVYPLLVLISIPFAGQYLLADNITDTKAEAQAALWFCSGHILLSVSAIVVSQYLALHKKANWLFVIINSITAGCFAVAIMGMYI